jgi:ABC-type glycerol-3-phosphate transport system substrate-binding protein
MDQYHLDWIEVARAQEGDWNFNPDVDGNFVFDPNNPDIHNTYTFSDQRFWAAFRDGILTYDTPGLAEITRNVAKIFPKHATSDLFVINDIYPRFISGQAAIMYNGTWAVSSLVNDAQTITPEQLEAWNLTAEDVNVPDWGTFEMPPMEGPLVKSPVRSIESAAGEYISIIEKDQAQTDLSVDFVQFWLSYAGYQPFNDASVAAKVNFSGPLKVYDVEEPPEVTALWEGVKFLGNAEVPLNWQILYFSNDDLTTHSRDMWKTALEGNMSPEEFAAGLQKLVMDNFDTILESSGLTQADLDNPARQPGT